MTLVSKPDPKHECMIGWLTSSVVDEYGYASLIEDRSVTRAPKGSVWRCDDCGKLWYARVGPGWVYGHKMAYDAPTTWVPKRWWHRT